MVPCRRCRHSPVDPTGAGRPNSQVTASLPASGSSPLTRRAEPSRFQPGLGSAFGAGAGGGAGGGVLRCARLDRLPDRLAQLSGIAGRQSETTGRRGHAFELTHRLAILDIEADRVDDQPDIGLFSAAATLQGSALQVSTPSDTRITVEAPFFLQLLGRQASPTP